MKKIILIPCTLLFLISCSNNITSDNQLNEEIKKLQQKYDKSWEDIKWREYCDDYEKIIDYQESYTNKEIIRNITDFAYSPKQWNCIYSIKTHFYEKDKWEYSPIETLMIIYQIESIWWDNLFEETCHKDNLDECTTFSEYQKVKFKELTK